MLEGYCLLIALSWIIYTNLTQTNMSVKMKAEKSQQEYFQALIEKMPKIRLPQDSKILKASWLNSPLGPMLAIADEEKLFLLEFVERRHLEREIERLQKKINATIIFGMTAPIRSIEQELKDYFSGQLTTFKTPLFLLGSPFQQTVWKILQTIPFGKTFSYAELASCIGKPTAFRAVANANGANQLAIIIPCHRVINSNGALGGYGGGITRKQWMLDHEKKNKANTD